MGYSRFIAIGLGLLVGLVGTTLARADDRTRGPAAWHDARGCYAFRGRLQCSRYCWRDINGHRYCHERESVAYPHTAELLGQQPRRRRP